DALITKDFMYYLLQTDDFQNILRDVSARAAQAGFNKQDLSSLLVALPPLPEQKRIAALLTDQMTAIDRARVAAETQLQAAKELPAAFLRSVFDSPEVDNWEKLALGDISTFLPAKS